MKKVLVFCILAILLAIGVASCGTLPPSTLVTPAPTSYNLNPPLTPTTIPTAIKLYFNLQPGEARRATNGSLELEIQFLGIDEWGYGHWTCSTKLNDGSIVDCTRRVGEFQEMVFLVGGDVVARATEKGEVKFTDSDWKQSPSSMIAP